MEFNLKLKNKLPKFENNVYTPKEIVKNRSNSYNKTFRYNQIGELADLQGNTQIQN